jgi:hypothetical protein
VRDLKIDLISRDLKIDLINIVLINATAPRLKRGCADLVLGGAWTSRGFPAEQAVIGVCRSSEILPPFIYARPIIHLRSSFCTSYSYFSLGVML